jgi:hypothetical protein
VPHSFGKGPVIMLLYKSLQRKTSRSREGGGHEQWVLDMMGCRANICRE